MKLFLCHCCENSSWGGGGKLKLAVPVGLPAGWAHLVMSHPSPRLPRFARNDIERLRSRGTPSMSLRGAGATWQSQGGAANGPRGSSGQYDAGAVRKPPLSSLLVAGDNTGMGDCCQVYFDGDVLWKWPRNEKEPEGLQPLGLLVCSQRVYGFSASPHMVLVRSPRQIAG
ncbi:hypothetical protein ACFLXE_01500 [Chloroflexota bacterium]